MKAQYEVLVSLYCNGAAYSRIIQQYFQNAESAVKFAKSHNGIGKSVIIRPSFCERGTNGIYFREWRNLGTGYKEVRWDTHLEDDGKEFPSADQVNQLI